VPRAASGRPYSVYSAFQPSLTPKGECHAMAKEQIPGYPMFQPSLAIEGECHGYYTAQKENLKGQVRIKLYVSWGVVVLPKFKPVPPHDPRPTSLYDVIPATQIKLILEGWQAHM
jgi:hypothetical protein